MKKFCLVQNKMDKLVGVPYLDETDINGERIEGVTQDGLLMIQADWCGHCKTAKPEFKKLFAAKNGKYFIGTVESLPTNGEFMKKLGVQGFPTFLKIKGGQIMGEADVGDRKLAGMMKALYSL